MKQIPVPLLLTEPFVIFPFLSLKDIKGNAVSPSITLLYPSEIALGVIVQSASKNSRTSALECSAAIFLPKPDE